MYSKKQLTLGKKNDDIMVALTYVLEFVIPGKKWNNRCLKFGVACVFIFKTVAVPVLERFLQIIIRLIEV